MKDEMKPRSLPPAVAELRLVRPMRRLFVFFIAVAACASPLAAQSSGHRNVPVYAKRPEYPAQAREQHLTGDGVFALHIRPDGSVERVEILKSIGHAALDRAATAAFRAWRFYPHSISMLRVPIRYVDGPPRVDAAMSRPPAPGHGALITVFSRAK
jgi:TonB family protein